MTNVAGLVMGIPGLLASTVQCFKYVQLSQSFGEDFSECILSLDMSRLRLSRWGAAFGIAENHQPDLSQFDANDLSTARRILESIQNCFKDRFKDMIADVEKKVNYLIEEFPPKKETEVSLCTAEAGSIKDPEDLGRLGALIGDNDPVLQEALVNIANERGVGHLIEDFKLSDSARMEVGDRNENGRESKGHVLRKFANSGQSVLNIRNHNS